MRRRDLIAIAATQQVREMQEGAAVNYNPKSSFACDRTPEPTLGKTIQLCFYLKKEISELYVPRNIFNNSAHGYSISTDRNICVCYYPKEDKLVVSSYSGISLYELKSPQTGMYNLCVTIDHEGLSKVYRDGVLVGQLKQSATTSTSPLFIGLGAANMATPPNLAISYSYGFAGNVMLLRIFNYALLPQQIAALYNNGKPEEYLLPTTDKVGCIAEYLPQNLITAHDGDMSDKTPIAWLDSAKQLPLNDEYLPPLLQGVGGYDLTALGTPEIVEKARVIQRQEITNFNVEGSISMGGGNSGQAVATLTKTADGSVLHCFGDFCWDDGVVNDQYPRLVCTAKQRAGSGTVKMTLEYEITIGNTQVVYLETCGWSLIKWTNLGAKLAGKSTCQFISIGAPNSGSVSSTPRLDFGGATFNGGEYKILVKKLIIEEYDKIIN